MGSGASLEEQNSPETQTQPPPQQPPPPASGAGRPGTSAASTRTALRSSSMATRLSSGMGSIRGRAMNNTPGFKRYQEMALGRQSVAVVEISKTGFSLQNINISKGDVVTFEWNEPDGAYNVTQVVHDGDQFRPVPGGYYSGPVSKKGRYDQQFNQEGVYKFVSAGIRCTPLTITVSERNDLVAEVTDEGFHPKLMRIDERNAVVWKWNNCSVPHNVYEVRFNPKTGKLVRSDDNSSSIATASGSYRQEFKKSGIYYFITEGNAVGVYHLCVIHIRDRQMDHVVQIRDREFYPPILVLEEGDRVWWTWDKTKCKKPHCVYQIDPPSLSHTTEESFKPKKDGFKWPTPTKCGLMSVTFNQGGVFYFSDYNQQEAAEYIGTIMVRPKPQEHFIELSADGFSPDLLYANTGDRVWWVWDVNDFSSPFMLQETDSCLSPVGKRTNIDTDIHGESFMDEEMSRMMTRIGTGSVQLSAIGTYHYRMSNSPNAAATSSIICQGGPRNHTVHITDTGFDPQVVTIRPNDRVWWVWQEAEMQHNVIQVSHQGNHIKDGFCSGGLTDPPDAFMHQFKTSGVFYFISKNVPKSFGAVVVSGIPKVHEVVVSPQGLIPDPVCVRANDVVAWTFRGLRQHDVQEVTSVDQLLDAEASPVSVAPRRCMDKLFKNPGTFHFCSKSFMKQSKKESQKSLDETRVSSVIVDDTDDNVKIRVDTSGFHPDTVNIHRGQSILWTWKTSKEAHNIVNVNPPDSDTPLNAIQGSKSFNSGRPVANNCFLYTFDDIGVYCVASQGAPGYCCSINVLAQAAKTETPYIVSDKQGGSVEKNHTVFLKSDTDGATIYYTLDGTEPELYKNYKMFKPEKGIVLKKSGLSFIRAMAVSKNALNSDIFTSQRFWVLTGDDENISSDEELGVKPATDSAGMKEWMQAAPTIKACFTNPGMMEVFWEKLSPEALKYVRAYQLFLNGISYSPAFSPDNVNAIVAGLSGDRLYEVVLEVYPNDPMFLPHKSNKLVMKCPKSTSTGGPVISLEVSAKPQSAIAVVWKDISTPQSPVSGYRVYLNGQQCGNKVVPDDIGDRCKVVIEECQSEVLYKIIVVSIGEDDSKMKVSNELEIVLPLETENICLPPLDARMDDEDLYKEYVEVRVESDKEPEPEPPKENLPTPTITVETKTVDTALVTWELTRQPDPRYRLLVYVVNVIGTKFQTTTNSDISYEAMQEAASGEQVPAVQHSWNVTKGQECVVKGLSPGLDYRFFVVANYGLVKGQQQCEIQATSATITYTTMGPPEPPTLRCVGLGLCQVTLEWEAGKTHDRVPITGYVISVDGRQAGGVLDNNTVTTTINNLQPGKTIKVNVVAVTEHEVGNSEASNTIKIACPVRPPPPHITQQPAFKKSAVIIAWEKPSYETSSAFEDISSYSVYVDQQWHGEMKANSTSNHNGYQYFLTDLSPGQSYDINVKSFAGQRRVEQEADTVYCLCESNMSNTLPATCAAPPRSPGLAVDGMSEEGIDITWEVPQQFGEAVISGYQLMKDGKLYGSIMPADVHRMRIKDVNLGDHVTLQILALTEHPAGRTFTRSDADSGFDGSSQPDEKELFLGEKYNACRPGPKLTVYFSGLVQAPDRVWCEEVTGHSAVIVWEKCEKPKPHYVQPESYQVTWWPGEKPEEDINSQSTTRDHLMISNLKSNYTYTVVVEARKMQTYTAVQEDSDTTTNGTFILTSKSEQLTVRTARPPEPASNIGVIATTCHSAQIGWDPPRERGVEVKAIRVDVVPMKPTDNTHICMEVVPDANNVIIENLSEKTEYMVTITAVTNEYFDQLPDGHDLKKRRVLPKHVVPNNDSPWCPSSNIFVTTSGSDPPTDLEIVDSQRKSITVRWKPAVVYGSNRLQGTIVRWSEARYEDREDGQLARHVHLQADANTMTIEDLQPGIKYKVVVEGIVSVKTVIEPDNKDPEVERRNRRTTHVMSKALYVRTKAPSESPRVYVTGYTADTITLYWEKPLLYTIVGKDSNDNPRCIKRALVGYKIEINGKTHMNLGSAAQTVTLTKCKAGKKYRIVVVALTCTEELKKEKRQMLKGSNLENSLSSVGGRDVGISDFGEDELDESPSDTVEVTTPSVQEGNIESLCAKYRRGENEQDLGDIQVEWTVMGCTDIIKQFNLTWRTSHDGMVQRKASDCVHRNAKIPVTSRKTVYNIVAEPFYNTDVITPEVNGVQCPIPGPPDAPEIFTKSVTDEEFVIEWGEPRLYVVKVRGYQLYLNGKKAGNVLNSVHRKAVVPCKAKRSYKVNLVALSADPAYEDSPLSNTLNINTGVDPLICEEEPPPRDDLHEVNLKVVHVGDTTIQLDWSGYLIPKGIKFFKVQWSSALHPAQRETRLASVERSCVLQNCFAGAKHYVRVVAVGEDDAIIDRSQLLTVQTNAPPRAPNVTLRKRKKMSQYVLLRRTGVFKLKDKKMPPLHLPSISHFPPTATL